MKQLLQYSDTEPGLNAYLPEFTQMPEHPNSFVRNRALVLLAANAKWDHSDSLNLIIDQYLSHIQDIKPITARQCIQALPQIAAAKPELRETILDALTRARPCLYPESMAGLVRKDIAASYSAILAMGSALPQTEKSAMLKEQK